MKIIELRFNTTLRVYEIRVISGNHSNKGKEYLSWAPATLADIYAVSYTSEPVEIVRVKDSQ